MSVVITGYGAVSAAGDHRARCNVPSEVPTLTRFDASTFPESRAFEIAKVRPQPYLQRRRDLKLMSQDSRLAVVAAGRALEALGFDPKSPQTWAYAPELVGCFMGCGHEPGDITELGPAVADCREGDALDLAKLGEHSINLIPPLSALKTLPNMALAHVAINFGLMGPGEALSPWSPSAFAALDGAVEALECGECPMALVGAADSDIDMNGMATMVRLGLAGEGKLVPGEGAAFVALECRESAVERGADVLATVVCARTLGAYADIGEVNAESLQDLVEGLPSPDLIYSGAAHHKGWLALEEDLFSAPVRRATLATGHTGAADGMISLVSALAEPDRWKTAWVMTYSPAGDCGVVVLSQEVS